MKPINHRVQEMQRLGFVFEGEGARAELVNPRYPLRYPLRDGNPAARANNPVYDVALQDNRRCKLAPSVQQLAMLDALLPAWREYHQDGGTFASSDRLLSAYKIAHVNELMDALQRRDGITLKLSENSDNVWEFMDARGKAGLDGEFGSDGTRPVCFPAPYARPSKKLVVQIERLLEKLLIREAKDVADEPCLAPARRIEAVAAQLLPTQQRSI